MEFARSLERSIIHDGILYIASDYANKSDLESARQLAIGKKAHHTIAQDVICRGMFVLPRVRTGPTLQPSILGNWYEHCH